MDPFDYVWVGQYMGNASNGQSTDVLRNGWLTVPADPAILFEIPIQERFVAAMNLLGIDPSRLTGDAGHA